MNLQTLVVFFGYSRWANDRLVERAAELSDEQLDRPLDIGRGTLRKNLIHTYAGEHVWLQRWMGRAETKWINEDERLPIPALAERFTKTHAERGEFAATLTDARLDEEITYRDSYGSLFRAKLSDMIYQAVVHSIHHRSQSVNMIRRLDGKAPELDYMMWVRKPDASE